MFLMVLEIKTSSMLNANNKQVSFLFHIQARQRVEN